MSTLQQSLQEQRAAAQAASSVTADARQSALIISVWQGDTWVLPWSQLLSVRLSADCLEMCFTPAHVIITGSNLGALLDDIAAFRLGCLRSLPADYSASGSTNGTFISRIEVRAAERDLGDKS